MSYISDGDRKLLNNLIKKWNMWRLVGINDPQVFQTFKFFDSEGKTFFRIEIRDGKLYDVKVCNPRVSFREKNWEQVRSILELFPFEEVKELLQDEYGSDEDFILLLQAGIFSSNLNAQQYLKEHLRKIEEHQRSAEACLPKDSYEDVIDAEFEEENQLDEGFPLIELEGL